MGDSRTVPVESPFPELADKNLVWIILGQFRLNLPPSLRSLSCHGSPLTADNIQQRPVGRILLHLQVLVEAEPAIANSFQVAVDLK